MKKAIWDFHQIILENDEVFNLLLIKQKVNNNIKNIYKGNIINTFL